jgi:citrate lyase subunit beta/citryl-CoA lyase
MAKAPATAADMCLLDLEDSVAPAQKEAARSRAAQAVRALDWGDRVVGVRINGWETAWTYSDVIGVVAQAGGRLDEVVLPKVQSPAEVEAIDLLLSQIERAEGLRPGRIGLEAQIESAAGLSNVVAICASSPRLVAVVFGPADFAASMGISSAGTTHRLGEAGLDWYEHALFQIAVAARSANLQVIDGPHFKLHDLDGLAESCRRSADCGYDGKWAVHPEQLQLINSSYTPDQATFDQASALADIYQRTIGDDGTGALAHHGEMVDEASRKVAVRTVKRGIQAGMTLTAQDGAP